MTTRCPHLQGKVGFCPACQAAWAEQEPYTWVSPEHMAYRADTKAGEMRTKAQEREALAQSIVTRWDWPEGPYVPYSPTRWIGIKEARKIYG